MRLPRFRLPHLWRRQRSSFPSLLLVLLPLVACYDSRDLAPFAGQADESPSDDETQGDEPDAQTETDLEDDLDEDGWAAFEDCDDQNPEVHPFATEACNDRDDDCDDLIDEGVLEAWFEDNDGDGYGRDESAQITCEPGPDLVPLGGDCDDDDPTLYPDNTALVDGVDSDCNGALDWNVTIHVAVDDAGELCIDTWDNILGDTGHWVHGTSYEYWLESGTHTIGVKGWDLNHVVTAAIVHIQISTGESWVSDASWRYDPDPWASDETRVGWCAPGFDDSGWDEVLDIGPRGVTPWAAAPYSFPSDSTAHWIWDHFPVDLNTQYLRKEFVLP